jgi:hypothetical protein
MVSDRDFIFYVCVPYDKIFRYQTI